LKKFKVPLFCLVLLFFITSFFFTTIACAGDKAKVLVLPFTLHAEKDLSFLNPGIMGMLSSRLSVDGRVTVIKSQRSDLDEQAALALAKTHNTDFLITGSLTVFGNSVSTDAQFLEVSTGKVLVPFNRFDPDQGAVLGHINAFAEQINTRVFGNSAPLQPATMAPQPADAPAPAVVIPAKKQPMATIQPAPAAAQPTMAPVTPEFLKSQNFNMAIQGLAMGDVTGDGQNEVVFTGDNTVFIYRMQDDTFIKVAESKGRKQDNYVTIDVADINGNGRAEIFVTCLANNALHSFVLEWQNNALRPIVTEADWYFRVLSVPGAGPLLFGQRRSMGFTDANEYELDRSAGLFLAGIYKLHWQNGSYVPGPRMDIPKELNLYSFISGDIANDNTEMTVFFTENDSLRLLDPTGRIVWKSREPYGGSAAYLDYPTADTARMDRFYLPQRILIADLDTDGKNEVLTVNNHEFGRRFLSRIRNFTNGWIEGLAWNKLTFAQQWRTSEVPGYISDYAAGDVDHDGRPEVIFAVVQKESGIMAGKTSFIVIQKILPAAAQ
jgi:TolB-like protein